MNQNKNQPSFIFHHFTKTLFVLAVILLAFADIFAASEGELDRSFNPTITFDATSIVADSVVQPDGKTIVVGTFLKINNQQVNHVTRFNFDGTLDATFDAGGGVVGDSSGGSSGSVVTLVALQSDGKIIVAGTFQQAARQIRYKLARLNADGSFDVSFNANLNPSLTNINALAVQPDGKILIGGSISIGNPSATFTAGLIRLNADGSRDTTFAPPSGAPRSIVAQTDGKILISGDSFTSGGQTRAQVARLNPNGLLDASFVGTTYDGTAFVVVSRANGKIYVGGGFQIVGGQQRRGLALLNADGTLDASFADAPSSRSGIRKLAVQSDGKPVFCGEGTFSNAVRANLDGSPDAAFITRSRLNGGVYTVAVLPDDRVVVGGNMDVFNPPRTAVEKRRFVALAADGTIDDQVNPYIIDSPNSTFDGADVIVQPDGKILYTDRTFSEVNRAARRRLVRLNPDGTTDNSFNLPTNLFEGTTRIIAIALQPDGKILFSTTGSGSLTDPRVGRLNSDGSLDNSFANITFNTSSVTRFAIQPNGQIIIRGGFTIVNGQARENVARLNADGSLDSFTLPSGLQVNFSNVEEVLIQPDGKFLITVLSSGNQRIARFNQNGSLDPTFASSNVINPLALQPDGKVLCQGNGLNRLNTDGSVDNTFAPVGFLVDNNFTGGVITTAVVTSSGKILVGGQFNLVRVNFGTSQPRSGFVRLNQDGTLDNTYGINGGAIVSTNNTTSNSAFVWRIALQPDGKALIGGLIRYVNNFSQPTLARLKTSAVPTANVISDFDGDGKTDASVFRAGTWYINPSSNPTAFAPNAAYGIQFGLATDKLVPADYDGDGKTDIAVWREGALGYFYILNSSNNTFRAEQFGRTGDNPSAVGNWDGDNKADLAVYRNGAAGGQSFFYYRPSSQPSVDFETIYWGTAGDEPVRGDFDGDGKLDAAVFRASNGIWYIRQSSNNQPRYASWGVASDKRVFGDFDGDGKTDLAIFRNGLWAITQSSNNQQRYEQYGQTGDRLVAGDYDGDGVTDIAVWRNGTYYIKRSTSSLSAVQQFGATGDVPAASAFVQ